MLSTSSVVDRVAAAVQEAVAQLQSFGPDDLDRVIQVGRWHQLLWVVGGAQMQCPSASTHMLDVLKVLCLDVLCCAVLCWHFVAQEATPPLSPASPAFLGCLLPGALTQGQQLDAQLQAASQQGGDSTTILVRAGFCTKQATYADRRLVLGWAQQQSSGQHKLHGQVLAWTQMQCSQG